MTPTNTPSPDTPPLPIRHQTRSAKSYFRTNKPTWMLMARCAPPINLRLMRLSLVSSEESARVINAAMQFMGDSAHRHFYLSLCFEFSPYRPSFAPGLTTRIAGGVILRDMSSATGSPRWFDKALQSLAQFPSPMKQSSLNRVDGNSHDSSGLFRRSLVKLTQLECSPCSVRQLIQSREQNSLPLAL